MITNEINRLGDKYLVIRHEDLERYFSQFTKGIFSTDEEKAFIDNISFNTVLEDISADRKAHGKKENRYVVLNLDNKIDIIYLTDLVNAILKAEDNK